MSMRTRPTPWPHNPEQVLSPARDKANGGRGNCVHSTEKWLPNAAAIPTAPGQNKPWAKNHCRQMGVRPSMETVGDAFDNAMAESFFARLECELIDRKTFKTRTEARLAVFIWIEGLYNPKWRHSALGYLSPVNFERRSTSIPESYVLRNKSKHTTTNAWESSS